MRRLIAWTLMMIAATSIATSASAQVQKPAAKKTNQAPTRATLDPAAVKAQQEADKKALEDMNPILAEWEIQSKKNKSLYVEIERVDQSADHDPEYFKGQAILKSPDLACLEFRKVKVGTDGKPVYTLDANGKKVDALEKDPEERLVCTGKEVVQFVYKNKVIYVYPLDKQIRQKALQEGPLPFLFDLKAAEARQRYTMRLLREDKENYLIGITPQQEIDKDSFERAFLLLGKADFLPRKLQLVKIQKEIQLYSFTKIVPNNVTKDDYFHPSLNIEKWQVKYNTNQDGSPQVQAGRPQPKARP